MLTDETIIHSHINHSIIREVVLIIIPAREDMIFFLENKERSFPEKVFPLFLSDAENLINTKIPEDVSLRKTGPEPAHIICVIRKGKEEPNALIKKEVSYIHFDQNNSSLIAKEIFPKVIKSLHKIAKKIV